MACCNESTSLVHQSSNQSTNNKKTSSTAALHAPSAVESVGRASTGPSFFLLCAFLHHLLHKNNVDVKEKCHLTVEIDQNFSKLKNQLFQPFVASCPFR